MKLLKNIIEDVFFIPLIMILSALVFMLYSIFQFDKEYNIVCVRTANIIKLEETYALRPNHSVYVYEMSDGSRKELDHLYGNGAQFCMEEGAVKKF